MPMELDNFIASLSGDLEPLCDLASRLKAGGIAIADDGVALSHRPHVAPQAYAMRLYAPLSAATATRYQEIHGIRLSPHYLRILEKLNGARVFEFSLFGIPPSMANDPPLLNRSAAQPYDVGTANQFWKLEYSVPREWFHFGGGPYSFDENIGYFLDEDCTIYCSRKNGEKLRSWNSFRSFLSDEVGRAEAKYPEHEAFMADAIRKYSPKPWWKRWLTR